MDNIDPVIGQINRTMPAINSPPTSHAPNALKTTAITAAIHNAYNATMDTI